VNLELLGCKPNDAESEQIAEGSDRRNHASIPQSQTSGRQSSEFRKDKERPLTNGAENLAVNEDSEATQRITNAAGKSHTNQLNSRSTTMKNDGSKEVTEIQGLSEVEESEEFQELRVIPQNHNFSLFNLEH